MAKDLGVSLTIFPNPVNFFDIYLVLNAAITPVATRVNARPILKPKTKVAPIATFLSCKQSKSTVIVAGQGIRPPVKPKSST